MPSEHRWHHIGLFGPSCVGKTTLARSLANRLSLTQRSCGEELRRLGTGRSVAVANESDKDYTNRRTVDVATIEIAHSAYPMTVIEGRFLDAVIGETPSILLFGLDCTEAERIRRYIVSKPGRTGSIQEEDEADLLVRRTMYYAHQAIGTPLVLDTSVSSVAQLTDKVLHLLGRPETK